MQRLDTQKVKVNIVLFHRMIHLSSLCQCTQSLIKQILILAAVLAVSPILCLC